MSVQKCDTITKDNINKMVLTFYAHILGANNDVSDVFVSKLGDDLKSDVWTEHIDILTNFWAMVALDDTEYKGNPLAMHMGLPLKKEMFGTWLGMFFEVIDDFYEPEAGMVFKQRAEDIAHNFMRKLSLK
jgi:hemoglobin